MNFKYLSPFTSVHKLTQRYKNPMNNFYNMEKIKWHHFKLDELKGNSSSLTHYSVFPLWLDFKWGIFRLLYGHI